MGSLYRLKHAEGMSLRFDGNLCGAYICVVSPLFEWWMFVVWWMGGNVTAPEGGCLWRCVGLEKTLLKDYLRIPSSFLAMIAR